MRADMLFTHNGEEAPSIIFRRASITLKAPIEEVFPPGDFDFDCSLDSQDCIELSPAECMVFFQEQSIDLYQRLNTMRLVISPLWKGRRQSKYF